MAVSGIFYGGIVGNYNSAAHEICGEATMTLAVAISFCFIGVGVVSGVPLTGEHCYLTFVTI